MELATGHHAIDVVADDPEGFSFPEGFPESYDYNTSDFKFCRQYNESSISWHDAIDAMFTRCHCHGSCERDSVVRSIDASCQTELDPEIVDESHIHDSISSFVETDVNVVQQ